MSDHPAHSAEARHGNEFTDPPRRLGQQASPEAPRAFRSEQRFTDPAAAAAPPPDWLAPTPATGIPMDPVLAASMYYNEHVTEHPAPSYRPTVPPTPYPDLSTSALLRQIKPAPRRRWATTSGVNCCSWFATSSR